MIDLLKFLFKKKKIDEIIINNKIKLFLILFCVNILLIFLSRVIFIELEDLGLINKVNNNKKIFSTMYNSDTEVKSTNNFINNKNNYTVEQKIYNIFNSPNYIYKIDVIIVTDKGKDKKRIVGKTKTNLITMNNEYIPINTIRDIYIDN